MVPVVELLEHPRNPNRHPSSQLELLANVIRANGWRSPIVVSNQSGFIVKGHGRYEAAKLLELNEVPVEFQDYATPADELADMIADNRLSGLSIIDEDALNALLDSIVEDGSNIAAAGFSESAFSELRKRVGGEVVIPEKESPARLDTEIMEKCVIGHYHIEITQAEHSAWLSKLYAEIGQDEAAILLEIKRRLAL